MSWPALAGENSRIPTPLSLISSSDVSSNDIDIVGPSSILVLRRSLRTRLGRKRYVSLESSRKYQKHFTNMIWVDLTGIYFLSDFGHRKHECIQDKFWCDNVNIRGTHLAETFDIPKMSVRIDCTAPKVIPTSLALLHRSRLVFNALSPPSAAHFFHCAIRRLLP